MVLVTMRDHNASNALAVLEKVVEARSGNINPEAVTGKGHSTVDEDDAIAALEREAVHSDLAQAAERDQMQVCGVHFRAA